MLSRFLERMHSNKMKQFSYCLFLICLLGTTVAASIAIPPIVVIIIDMVVINVKNSKRNRCSLVLYAFDLQLHNQQQEIFIRDGCAASWTASTGNSSMLPRGGGGAASVSTATLVRGNSDLCSLSLEPWQHISIPEKASSGCCVVVALRAKWP